ncbi:phosphatidylinositol 4-phosphate 3-kinase C2 domain-containing subunit alpha [Lissotriton helveticus]
MAQTSSSNGHKPGSSPSLGTARPKDVGKEEALQMEAEALAKLQKDRPVSFQDRLQFLSTTRNRVPAFIKQDQDLMVFPESDAKKMTEDKLCAIDIDKLTHAELEKLLLDDSFETRKPPTLPVVPVLAPSISSQYYAQSPFQGQSWTPGFRGTVACTLPPVYSSAITKQVDPFQNGFPQSMSPYRSREPLYLSLPGRTQFMPFSLSSSPPFHIRGSLPTYSPVVPPSMAKIFDKIAVTSEFQKNGKLITDSKACIATTSLSKAPTPEASSDISKFDWLDLDPLSKPKGENSEIPHHAVDCDGNSDCGSVSEDPWDAVLLKESPAETCHQERKMHIKSPSGASVTRSHSLNIHLSKSLFTKLQSQTSQVENGTNAVASEGNRFLQEIKDLDEEVAAFCHEVSKLRNKFPWSNSSTNPGFLRSPVMLERNLSEENAAVKVSIEIEGSLQPVTFTCDVSSPVELIIMQALCWVHDDLNLVDIGSYILKVCGQEEVLQNAHCLGSHEYIQICRKWDTEIKLQLLSHNTICRDLARTVTDDETPTDLHVHMYQVDKPYKEPLTRQSIEELLDAYHNQVEMCLKNENDPIKLVDQLIKAVRRICSEVDGVETLAITDSVKKLKRAVHLPKSKGVECSSKSLERSSKNITDVSAQPENPVQESIIMLTTAVHELLRLYFSSRSTSSVCNGHVTSRSTKDAQTTTDHLQFTIFAGHNIPVGWISTFEKYYLVCSLTHNGIDLFKPVQSKKVGTYKSFFYLIKWDELIIFPVQVSQLPLESILKLSLYGIFNQNSSGSPDSNKQRKGPEMLGQVSLSLFDFQRLLTCGTKLLNLWTSFSASSTLGAGAKKGCSMERIVIQVDFPSATIYIAYKAPVPGNISVQHDLEKLDKNLKLRLLTILSKDSMFGLSKEEKKFLWDMRYYCHEHKNSLPKILTSVPSWNGANLSEVYALINQWPPLAPVDAMELLDSRFADQEVRTIAVNWIEAMISDDELGDFLPQFVQALKYEIYLDNALVRFLLSRALGNIRIAHYLYWLLKDALNDPHFGVRYEHILGALLSVCGIGLREELMKENRLVQLLGLVAEKVRQTSGSSRQTVLQEEMERVQTFFVKNKCRLPINPSLVPKECNTKVCSFFNSNAVPLKVTMLNADPLGDEINVMFKVGEDLRQDMLALQIIKIMDKIWLQEGLDLRMVIFKCLSTGKDRGMVELVLSSETLRKIQVEYGVTGSFKDKPLAEWLRKYNPSDEDYEKASENFIYSCAGCCVATYVLGICDRHNDNIMLRNTGHMFHIDFGKFLGHAQMFGSFKRDRAPFVLTSDMAYVINGGEKPTSRFQLFVDLCCQAYNLIRKHTNLFLNLLSLMMSSGLPELSGIQDLKYVQDALQPQTSDIEATIFFTRLIESSLGSMATKFNFFIHNLAQMRSSGPHSNNEPIFSFSPKTYSLKQDGRIREVSVFTYQKRYSPDKHYVYVLTVLREGQDESAFIFRTFDEFQELHNKLSILFPLWKLPGFPNRMVLGRTHVKDVAAKRKMELNSYLQSLMDSCTEVAECDLVYTFFHPLLRDDKADGIEGIEKSITAPPMSPASGKVGGKVKLSISYRNGTLFIMVMHIKDLVTEDGADPNPYVKTYLLPDPHKTSKRKTKISRKTSNPTFNEMLVYSGYSKETLKQRELQLSVLSAESLRENFFLGGITLSLKDFNLNIETVNWYKLTAVPYL